MTAAGAWHPDPIGEASWRLWDGANWSNETAPAGQAQVAPLANALGRSLQLDEKGNVLYCDGSPVALMHRRTIGDATGETSTGAWTFDRKGIVNDSISVLVQPSQQEIARFAWDGPGTGTNGNLQFPDGRWFRFTDAKRLATEGVAAPAEYNPHHKVWVWYGPGQSAVMSVRLTERGDRNTMLGKAINYSTYRSGKLGKEIYADLHPPAADTRELPLLTTLGVWLVFLHQSHSDALKGERVTWSW